MNIRKTFLQLTKKTYPHGTEDQLISFLPRGYFKDGHGNFYLKIGKSKTAFTCHLDTASSKENRVFHVIEGNLIKTDGTTILGADDKAGVTILLYMIHHNIPGLYCFFIGEEVGCIGSSKASMDSMFKTYKRMISFDRRGTTSVITHQSSSRCCSELFAQELSTRFNSNGMSKMAPDSTGVYTDSAEFTTVIPECTNISVGYYCEHTTREHQDIKYLETLANSCLKIDWESLPTIRDPKVVETKQYRGYTYSDKDEDYYNYYDMSGGYGAKSRSTRRGYVSNSWKSLDSGRGGGRSRKPERDYYEYDQTTESGRSFLDTLDNDITKDINNFENSSKRYYDGIKHQLFDTDLTNEEYLIMSDNFDRLMGNDPNFETFFENRSDYKMATGS